MAEEMWCTIESDPGVFTELMAGMGVQGVQMEEIYSLDEATMEELKPIYGLIFLFKWQNKKNGQPAPEVDENSNVFFANQVINNACATQAILQILNFKEFTADFPPDMKGLAISNSELVRTEKTNVYHFIAYTPIHGALYELDGLSRGPVNLGACDDNNWTNQANEAIQRRMQGYGDSELHFSLMALTKDKVECYQEQIEELDGLLLSLGEDAVNERNQLNNQRSSLQHTTRWHRENVLRKHNLYQ
ncbi:hypothetical protein EDC94DRAFT_622724 [Helicostylum pulchrum]|nr:hypothetical protein EDC94DRAFT_622724 [Helicostylum pulchrum]